MCIRDRGKVATTKALTDLGLERGRYFLYVTRFEPENHPLLVREAFEAVSYTHLRAHETVLDLVCRLLLEKKKYLISNCVGILSRSCTSRAATRCVSCAVDH